MVEKIFHDKDPDETREWQDALEAVIAHEGQERAHFLLEKLIDQARRNGAYLPLTRSSRLWTRTVAGFRGIRLQWTKKPFIF